MNNSCDEKQIRALQPALLEVATRELNEVPHRVADDIRALREWLTKQSHLCCCTEDQFLLSFLRGTKFSVERAKSKIDRFYTLQTAIPEIFNAHRLADDPMVLEIIRLGAILQIPLDPNDSGPAVTIIRAGCYDLNKYKIQDIIRVGSMFGEIMMFEDDNATVSGYLEILDMTDVSSAHLFALQPDLMRKFLNYADAAMPTRQKGIHFINTPNAFETGFNAVKSFFPGKIKNRVSVSSNPEAIFEFVRREYLPEEYGGTRGTVQKIITNMEEKILRYKEYFEQSQHFGTNEKLRENGNIDDFDTSSSFGANGSFRQLDID